MEKIWLKQYPQGHSGRSRYPRVRVAEGDPGAELPQVRRPSGLQQHGRRRSPTASWTSASRDFGAYLQKVAGPAQGRPGGDHAAQPAAVPGGAVRRAARRA